MKIWGPGEINEMRNHNSGNKRGLGGKTTLDTHRVACLIIRGQTLCLLSTTRSNPLLAKHN